MWRLASSVSGISARFSSQINCWFITFSFRRGDAGVVSWRLLIGKACRARRGAPRRGRGRRRSARWVQGSAARDAGDPRRGRARKVRGGGRRDDLVLDAAGSRVEHGLAAEGGLRVGEQVARAAGYGLGVAADVQERSVSIEGQERGGR